ncbi:glycosyltransferase [Pararobbsia alpina]|uniref:N-acetyl-alpha-D-glucosaminyl L-malate synthase n=1 Tax=Pararobbsia alpina TaxID=621374 RepID=A0A6S7BVK3_9BURK|nr:glycosyltransferase [Pararobbsia alpina]CAB3804519.1 N-acetyl-alpha-D-glucosaminyl L-malate synthase [Pararobbsia alpina]
MKIIHLANHVLEIGNGIVNVMVDLACGQADAGHDVVVASAGGQYEALLAEHGVRHIQLVQEPRPAKLLPMCWRFSRIVRAERPDIVHAHMMTGVLIARVVRAFARGRAYRLVSTVHNEFQRSAIVMGIADRVVAVSAAVAESMKRRGVPEVRLRTIANGSIGSPRTAASAASSSTLVLERPNVMTVAGMYRRKGIDVLLRAFKPVAAQLPHAHLYIVGDGPDRAEFEALAHTLGLEGRAHFLGFRQDVPALLEATDVFVLPSLQEPFGLVISEAREAGCAVVASDVGGIPEAMSFGRAGVLVPPGDHQVLGRTLHALLADDTLRNTWRERARTDLEWLEVGRVNADYLAVYEEVLGRRTSRKPVTA